MSLIVKYFFDLSDLGTTSPDFDRLINQVKGTQYPTYDAKGESGGVSVYSTRNLTEEELEDLKLIMANHNGEPIDFLSKTHSDEMRRRIQDILATAIDRVDLAPAVPNIKLYLNYRNKELDGYIYYGALDELITTIMSDNVEGQPFYDLLNTVVSADGTKAYQFFIGKLTGQI